MKQKRWLKVLLALLVIGLVAFLCIRYLLPLSHLLTTEEGRMEIGSAIEEYGIFAPLIFIGMMALQIVIAFIPGGPMELLGGMLFGSVRGILYSALGVLLGMFLVVLLVKCFGKPVVNFFLSEEQLERFSVLRDEKKLEFWVFILFLIPGIPKDLLTYVVPLTKISTVNFLFLATIARMPALVASVLIGDSLTKGNYVLCIIVCAVAAVLAFAGFRLKSVLMEKKGKST